MAKQGFSYYKAETDRFQDIKIKRLKKKYHCAGYAVYQYVLNEIYRVRGYCLPFTEDHLFDVSEYWDIEEEEVTAIIGYCAEIGLFDNRLWQEKGVLTARSIQTRYIDICKVCKKTPAIEEELRLVEAEKAAQAPEPLPQLFPREELPSMRIVPKAGADAVPKGAADIPEAAAPMPAARALVTAQAETGAEGAGKRVLSELEAREAEAFPEGFRKFPETSGSFPEESDKSIKSYASINSSSNSPSREEADKASRSSGKERLRRLLRAMSIAPDDARWIGTIEGIDADGSPLWLLADEVRQSRGRLTVCSYLMPSLRSLVAAGRLTVRRQAADTSEELRRLLRQVRVPSYDIGRVLEAAQGQERALREAIDEVRRSKGKISMPARYILSKLRKAAPAKAS
ncbi:DUF4373 domain-containing protein [uncultured Bacteroides sp.]|uniref:DUF4373 domain-containing protein n=2 Tax=uncultured Bacteroides sp. TaxID=162156 RepID=UPI00258D873B|nr:DUF4373 domain-containing protein [uncultured Bacteroides sp.]